MQLEWQDLSLSSAKVEVVVKVEAEAEAAPATRGTHGRAIINIVTASTKRPCLLYGWLTLRLQILWMPMCPSSLLAVRSASSPHYYIDTSSSRGLLGCSKQPAPRDVINPYRYDIYMYFSGSHYTLLFIPKLSTRPICCGNIPE